MKPTSKSQAAAAELRAQAEARAPMHAIQVHSIELEMQSDELRRAQHELDTSRARYLDLYELAPVGYCTVSAKGLILEANLTLATLLGVARGTLATKPFFRHILREDQDAFYLLFKKLLAANAAASPAAALPIPPTAVELRLVKSDGTGFWTQLLATVAADEQGETTLRLAVTDISARRGREAADRQEAQTQMEILNAIPAPVALVDPEGIIRVTNESWRRFATANFLQGHAFALGQNYLKVCESATGPCSDEAKDAAAGIRRVLRGEVGEFSIEYPCHSPTEQRWFRLMATPLREGLQAGAVVMHVNVTERKLAEQ